jgi:pyridoxamine 5'-phosphate oxidase
MNTQLLASLRKEYTQRGLSESEMLSDPIEQFGVWLKEAIAAGVTEPNAMSLATVAPSGAPATRIVLLKDYGPEGFVFFTNLESRKARELAVNPRTSLLFHWTALERQVRVEGRAHKVSETESETYFHGRPHESQVAAWTSPQSHIIPNREFLDEKFSELRKHYDGRKVPCPPQWGGFRVTPDTIEFWQGRRNRLHDRLQYIRQDTRWLLHRLAP